MKYYCNSCWETKNSEYGCYLDIRTRLDGDHGKLVSCVLKNQEPPAKWIKIEKAKLNCWK